MRAALAPALLSERLAREGAAVSSALGWLEVLAAPRTAAWLKLAAAGELLGDKLPMTPARVLPGPLAGRALSGALCGAVLYAAAGRRQLAGAALGGAAALAGAFGMYHLRRAMGERGVSDLLLAGLEDALAISLGCAALSLGNRR